MYKISIVTKLSIHLFIFIQTYDKIILCYIIFKLNNTSMVLFKFVLIIYHTVIEKSKKWMQVIFKEINEKQELKG